MASAMSAARCAPVCTSGFTPLHRAGSASRVSAMLPARRAAPARLASKTFSPMAAQKSEQSTASETSKVPAAAAAAALAMIAQVEPAMALDLSEGAPLWFILLEYVVLAGGYLVVAPALLGVGCGMQIGIFYLLKTRWFKRGSFETMLQFCLVFVFFPGLFLASPFLNFRPEDPGEQGEENVIM